MVERDLAKVDVESSNLFTRSILFQGVTRNRTTTCAHLLGEGHFSRNRNTSARGIGISISPFELKTKKLFIYIVLRIRLKGHCHSRIHRHMKIRKSVAIEISYRQSRGIAGNKKMPTIRPNRLNAAIDIFQENADSSVHSTSFKLGTEKILHDIQLRKRVSINVRKSHSKDWRNLREPEELTKFKSRSALGDGMIASHSTTWTGVPEPSSITLAGLAGLALLRRRR